MKRVSFYIVLVLAALLIGTFFFWHGSRHAKENTVMSASPTPTSVAASEKSTSNTVASETNAPIDLARVSAQGSKQIQDMFGIKPNMTPEEVKQKVADWYLEQARKMAARDQHPIIFYGKTVDESNQPLADANVHFSLNGGLAEKDLHSDADGNFYISDLVGKLLIIDIYKNGYYSSKNCHAAFDYARYLPNPLQPEIFQLRKKGAGVDLISAVLNAKMPRDGTPVNIDLIKGKAEVSGQLQMSQIKPPYESWKKATAWSFRMEIPDGGLVEENEEFPFEAPEDGYQSAIDFNFKASQPDWKTRLTESYYFVFGNPRRYGQMTVQTDIMWGGARITYAINPDGSRYLEPKQ
jgi:hypothetical protein